MTAPPRQLDQLGFTTDPRHPQLAARLAWLRAQGVRYVGFDLSGPLEAAHLPAIRRQVEDNGLHLVAIHGEPGMVTPDGDDEALRQAHREVLQRATALGADLVTLHFRILHHPVSATSCREENAFIARLGLAEYDRRMTELLRFVAEEAEARGLRLALENLPVQWQYAWRLADLLEYLGSLDLPHVGFCLDSGHAHLAGEDVPGALRQGRDRLLTTHLHDNFGPVGPEAKVLDSDRHLTPGLGTLNWPEVIRALRDIAYRAPIMFEGLRTVPHGKPSAFEPAVAMALANWAVFEDLADQLELPPAHR